MSGEFSHITVLLNEAVEALAIRPDGVYVDATFGRGGHSGRILAALGPAGRLIAFDRDPRAIEAGRALADPRLTLVHEPFSAFAGELDRLGELGCPVLLGASRKSTIGLVTGRAVPADRVAGSVAAHLYGATRGAAIIRVHDVRDHADAFKVWSAIAAEAQEAP